jgi:hypothetical protein
MAVLTMTRDDIIHMAEQAGAHHLANVPGFTDFLTRFVESVRCKMISEGWRQCAQGQRTSQFCAVAEQVRLEEREACVKVCENEGARIDASWTSCAAAIRARGQV